MKPPSFLTIVLFVAALPTGAAAERKPGERCDTPFLYRVVKEFTGIDSVKDAENRIKAADVSLNGVTYRQDVLKFDEDKTCDAGTRRFLAAPGAEPAWRNPAAKKAWEAGSAKQHAELMLVADDYFRAVDPKVQKVLAAADAVIEAGVQLGFVTVADTAKPLSELLPGGSGGAFAALKPKAVTFVDAGKQSSVVAPENAGPVWRKLLDEKGAARAGGAAVLDFRMAVLELNAEIGRVGGKEFMPALPDGYIPAEVKKAAALNDVKYDKALADLIGAGVTPALDAAAPRAGSALEPADLGARNLVAVRAGQVEEIVKAARARLGKKTITAIEVAARAGVEGKGAKPIAGAALNALAQTPEYVKLNELYDLNLSKNGADHPTTRALAEAREEMKTAALTAGLEEDNQGRAAVVFTQNGRKTTLGTIVPPQEGSDGDAARENAADVVARYIVDGKSDKLKTLGLALGDPTLNPGQDIPSSLTNAELAAAKEVPPAIAKINADGAGCKNPNDIVRNNYESYAARKQAAASAMATETGKSRKAIQEKEKIDTAASKAECQRLKDKAGAIVVDKFTRVEVRDQLRAEATAKANEWCEKDAKEIAARVKKSMDELDKAEAAGGDRDPGKGLTQATEELKAAFSLAVEGSVAVLRRDYTNGQGSPRLAKLMAATKLGELDRPKLVANNAYWFNVHWPVKKADEKELPANLKKDFEKSLSTCMTALGYSAVKKDSKVNYSNPENPDTVSRKCGIEKDVTQHIQDILTSVNEKKK